MSPAGPQRSGGPPARAVDASGERPGTMPMLERGPKPSHPSRNGRREGHERPISHRKPGLLRVGADLLQPIELRGGTLEILSLPHPIKGARGRVSSARGLPPRLRHLPEYSSGGMSSLSFGHTPTGAEPWRGPGGVSERGRVAQRHERPLSGKRKGSAPVGVCPDDPTGEIPTRDFGGRLCDLTAALRSADSGR